MAAMTLRVGSAPSSSTPSPRAPKPGRTLYVGATEEEAETSRAGRAAADGLWSEALWLAPGLRDAEVLDRFEGLRPRLPSELPLIGPHPGIERLLLAVGHHRNGVLLAPLTAQRIARMVVAA